MKTYNNGAERTIKKVAAAPKEASERAYINMNTHTKRVVYC